MENNIKLSKRCAANFYFDQKKENDGDMVKDEAEQKLSSNSNKKTPSGGTEDVLEVEPCTNKSDLGNSCLDQAEKSHVVKTEKVLSSDSNKQTPSARKEDMLEPCLKKYCSTTSPTQQSRPPLPIELLRVRSAAKSNQQASPHTSTCVLDHKVEHLSLRAEVDSRSFVRGDKSRLVAENPERFVSKSFRNAWNRNIHRGQSRNPFFDDIEPAKPQPEKVIKQDLQNGRNSNSFNKAVHPVKCVNHHEHTEVQDSDEPRNLLLYNNDRDADAVFVSDLPLKNDYKSPSVAVTTPISRGRDYIINERLKKEAAWYKEPRDPTYKPIIPSPKQQIPATKWSSVADPDKRYDGWAEVSKEKYLEEFPALSGEVSEKDTADSLRRKKEHDKALKNTYSTFTVASGHPALQQTPGYSWMSEHERNESQSPFDPDPYYYLELYTADD